MFVLTSNFQRNKGPHRLFTNFYKGEEHLFVERTNLFGSLCNSMLLILKCAYFSGLLLRAVHSASSTEYVVFPRLLDERGLDVERMLYIRDDIILRLKKNTVLGERFTFSETVNGTREDTIMDGKQLEANLFHDRIRMASVKVEDKNGAVEVRGILSNRLRITPLHISARSNDGLIPHKIYQVDQRAEDTVSFKADLTRNDSESVFKAELRIVVDLDYRSHFEDEKEMIEYLAICVQLVNIRYEDTKEPMVQFLLTRVERDAGMVPHMIYGKDADCPSCPKKFYAEADRTLEAANSFYGHNKEQDITVFVTLLDLADNHHAGHYIENKVMGLSKFGGLCSERERIAVVEDAPPTYSMIQLVAHELAHTLGVTHDGQYPELPGMPPGKCNASDGYIMAPKSHGSNNGHFSNCSINQIRAFVSNLSNDCRKVKSTIKINQTKNTELPGKDMNITRYCQLKYKRYSNITAIQEDEMKKQCKFKCCRARINECLEEIAVDGMPCGIDMMCFRNKCIQHYNPFKKSAPAESPKAAEMQVPNP
uniref:Putative metalloprotease n=1 Tax=Ixodes ricinus TaxID=34613 RepID=A0A0K8RAG3_IXORI